MTNPPFKPPPDWAGGFPAAAANSNGLVESSSTHPPASSSGKTRIVNSATATSIAPAVSARGRKHTPSLAVRSPVPLAKTTTANTSGSVITVASSTTTTAASIATTTNSNSNKVMPAPPPFQPMQQQQLPKKTKKKKKKKKRSNDWPTSSAQSLPPLSHQLVQRLRHKDFDVPINEECTSLCLSPSGRLVIACFSDGTLRLFDLTGTFANNNRTMDNNDWNSNLGFDYDSSSDSSSSAESSAKHMTTMNSPTFSMNSTTSTNTKKGGGARNQIVCSKENQRFGAVVAQIEAKGVHTSLIMDGAVAQDGQYCFAGVSRGSMEMMAVHLGKLEEYYDQQKQSQAEKVDLLDLVTVFRHSDAKLRGFGACTRVRCYEEEKAAKYLICTGKGIKNIHIWSFEPPLDPCAKNSDAKWVQLYNTPTNGNTIMFLQFRYDPNGLLHAISKSDDAQLRVWDLSYEQHEGNPKNPFYHKASIIQKFAKIKGSDTSRPKRPSFCDVSNSESTMSVCGGFAVCAGGSGAYNQISLISLDGPDLQSPYNHTELALPDAAGGSGDMAARTSRRQQRGELKSIVNIAGMIMDPSQFLLEVCDGSIIGYSQIDNGVPNLKPIPGTMENGFGALQQEGVCKQLSLGRIGSEGVVVVAVATYNHNSGKGRLSLRELTATGALSAMTDKENATVPQGFWGFAPQRRRCAKVGSGRQTALRDIGSSNDEWKVAAMTLSSPFPQEREDIVNWANPPASAPRGAPSSKPHQSTSVKLFGSSGASLFSPKLLKRKSSVESAQRDSSKSFNKKKKVPLATPKQATTLPPNCQNTVASAPPKCSRQSKMPPKCKAASAGTQMKQSLSTASRQDVTTLSVKAKMGANQSAPLRVVPTATLAQITPSVDPTSASAKKPAVNMPTAAQDATTADKSLAESPSTSTPIDDAKKVSPESAAMAKPASTSPSSISSGSATNADDSPPVPRKGSNNMNTQSVKETDMLEEDDLRGIAATLMNLSNTPSVKPAPPVLQETPADKPPVVSAAKTTDTVSKPKRSRSPGPTLRRKNMKKSPSAYQRKSSDPSQAFRDHCVASQKKVQVILKRYTNQPNIFRRMGLASSSANDEDDLDPRELARKKLFANHRATHEILLRKVLYAANNTLQALRRAKTCGAIDDFSSNFHETVQSYRDMLNETLHRQHLEASTLAAQQTLVTPFGGQDAPEFEVSFPFSDVLNEAIACVEEAVSASL